MKRGALLLLLAGPAAAALSAEPAVDAPALAGVAPGMDLARLGSIFDAARTRLYTVAGPGPIAAAAVGSRMRAPAQRRAVHIEVGPRPAPSTDGTGLKTAPVPPLVVPEPAETAAYRRHFRRLLDKPELTDRYDETILKYAQAYRLDPRLLKAIISAESEFSARALSPMGARGLMQVMPATAEMLGVPAYRLYEPEANIRAGAAYVARLFAVAWRRYHFGKLSYRRAPHWLLQRIIASYNAGPRFLFRSGGWYEQTRHYVRKVLLFYRSQVTQFRRPDRRWDRAPSLPLASIW